MHVKWIVIILAIIVQNGSTQDEEGPYWGKLIGKLNSYHHQVSGDVYAVNERTILLVNFNYDGTGDDTFFWAGDSGRPGPQGFIVPDQHGKTNILERYYNEEVLLTLPEGKRISRLKWFAVYDVASQNAFGDVFIPDDFEAPAERAIGPLVGDKAVSSQSVKVLDASTIVIPEFKYDGSGTEVYFWTGVGPQPSPRGYQIPESMARKYTGEDIRLELPGGKTVNDIKWISIWDAGSSRSLATVLVPAGLSVPPSTKRIHPYRSSLPHCKQLHRDLQVSWEVFGSQITVELAGKLESNEYMAFGISGSGAASAMQGADVAVASYSAALQRPLAADYNVSAQAQCIYVLGRWQGVCRDERLGGVDDNQVLGGGVADGLTRVTYRRALQPAEAMDLPWRTDGPQYVVWAVGPLDYVGEPGYHRLYPRHDIPLQLGSTKPQSDCYNFTM
ncbi:hypothetical protein ACJJTC_015192 [Scirpophaga incertulas]